MSSSSITLTGFKELQAKLKTAPKKLFAEIDGEVEDAADMWAGLAKRDAPVDNGFLSRGIEPKKVKQMEHDVVSNAEYSAYVEWGTGKKVQVPPELQAYAMQFKGKGEGDYYDFLNAILDWVKRKGISNVINSYTGKKVGGKAAKENLLVVAEAIAFSIMVNGIRPQPFFFIQRPKVEKELIKNIKNVLNTPI